MTGRLAHELDPVERAYAVFAAYGLPPVMGYCTHCDTAEYERRFHAPLRELTPDNVREYVWDAIHHTGDERDFLHFVPRVLEEIVSGRADDVSLWCTRFPQAGWTAWSEEERKVVRDAFHVAWQRELAAYPGPYRVEELLSGLGIVLGDLAPLLAAWAARTDEPAVLHRAELRGERLRDAYWEDGPKAQVEAWLESLSG